MAWIILAISVVAVATSGIKAQGCIRLPPPEPEHGEIEYSAYDDNYNEIVPTPNTFRDGDMAHLNCDDGYYPNDGDTAMCNNGKWGELADTCLYNAAAASGGATCRAYTQRVGFKCMQALDKHGYWESDGNSETTFFVNFPKKTTFDQVTIDFGDKPPTQYRLRFDNLDQTSNYTEILKGGPGPNIVNLPAPIEKWSFGIELIATEESDYTIKYIIVPPVTPSPSKQSACLVLATDISESLTDQSHLQQMTDAMDVLWTAITSNKHYEKYDFKITYAPFNEEVVEGDVKSISSDPYADSAAFVAAEKAAFDQIKADTIATETQKLTDLAPVMDYVAGMQCEADVRAVVIMSDFIFTTGLSAKTSGLEESLASITAKQWQIVAVGLKKERVEANFKTVAGKGYEVDLGLGDDAIQQLNEAIDKILV